MCWCDEELVTIYCAVSGQAPFSDIRWTLLHEVLECHDDGRDVLSKLIEECDNCDPSEADEDEAHSGEDLDNVDELSGNYKQAGASDDEELDVTSIQNKGPMDGGSEVGNRDNHEIQDVEVQEGSEEYEDSKCDTEQEAKEDEGDQGSDSQQSGEDAQDEDYETSDNESEGEACSDEEYEDDKVPPIDVLRGLIISEKDMATSNDLVLISGHKPDAEGKTGLLHCEIVEGVAHRPKVTSEDPPVLVINITPTDDNGRHTNTQTGQKFRLGHGRKNFDGPVYDSDAGQDSETHADPGGSFLITFNAYCILKTAAPKLTTEALYRLFMANQGGRGQKYPNTLRSKTVKYGVIHRSFRPQSPAFVHVICASKNWRYSEKWRKMLSDESRTVEERLWEAWMGKGNLWVYVRPDDFPIAQCIKAPEIFQVGTASGQATSNAIPSTSEFPQSRLASLPLDILFLICESLLATSLLRLFSTNKYLRMRLLPHINQISYRAMDATEPFYFPAKPIKTPDGTREHEELDRWVAGWLAVLSNDSSTVEANSPPTVSQSSSLGDDTNVKEAPHHLHHALHQKAPWFAYRVECGRSASMRNRRRIWGISEQLEEAARDQGILGSLVYGDAM